MDSDSPKNVKIALQNKVTRKEAEKARVLFSHGTGKSSSYGNKVEASIMAMRKEGLDVNAIAIPRASGFVTGLQAYLPYRGGPWSELHDMDFDARCQAIQDSAFCERLVAQAKERGALISEDQVFYLGDGDRWLIGQQPRLNRRWFCHLVFLD